MPRTRTGRGTTPDEALEFTMTYENESIAADSLPEPLNGQPVDGIMFGIDEEEEDEVPEPADVPMDPVGDNLVPRFDPRAFRVTGVGRRVPSPLSTNAKNQLDRMRNLVAELLTQRRRADGFLETFRRPDLQPWFAIESPFDKYADMIEEAYDTGLVVPRPHRVRTTINEYVKMLILDHLEQVLTTTAYDVAFGVLITESRTPIEGAVQSAITLLTQLRQEPLSDDAQSDAYTTIKNFFRDKVDERVLNWTLGDEAFEQSNVYALTKRVAQQLIRHIGNQDFSHIPFTQQLFRDMFTVYATDLSREFDSVPAFIPYESTDEYIQYFTRLVRQYPNSIMLDVVTETAKEEDEEEDEPEPQPRFNPRVIRFVKEAVTGTVDGTEPTAAARRQTELLLDDRTLKNTAYEGFFKLIAVHLISKNLYVTDEYRVDKSQIITWLQRIYDEMGFDEFEMVAYVIRGLMLSLTVTGHIYAEITNLQQRIAEMDAYTIEDADLERRVDDTSTLTLRAVLEPTRDGPSVHRFKFDVQWFHNGNAVNGLSEPMAVGKSLATTITVFPTGAPAEAAGTYWVTFTADEQSISSARTTIVLTAQCARDGIGYVVGSSRRFGECVWATRPATGPTATAIRTTRPLARAILGNLFECDATGIPVLDEAIRNDQDEMIMSDEELLRLTYAGVPPGFTLADVLRRIEDRFNGDYLMTHYNQALADFGRTVGNQVHASAFIGYLSVAAHGLTLDLADRLANVPESIGTDVWTGLQRDFDWPAAFTRVQSIYDLSGFALEAMLRNDRFLLVKKVMTASDLRFLTDVVARIRQVITCTVGPRYQHMFASPAELFDTFMDYSWSSLNDMAGVSDLFVDTAAQARYAERVARATLRFEANAPRPAKPKDGSLFAATSYEHKARKVHFTQSDWTGVHQFDSSQPQLMSVAFADARATLTRGSERIHTAIDFGAMADAIQRFVDMYTGAKTPDALKALLKPSIEHYVQTYNALALHAPRDESGKRLTTRKIFEASRAVSGKSLVLP